MLVCPKREPGKQLTQCLPCGVPAETSSQSWEIAYPAPVGVYLNPCGFLRTLQQAPAQSLGGSFPWEHPDQAILCRSSKTPSKNHPASQGTLPQFPSLSELYPTDWCLFPMLSLSHTLHFWLAGSWVCWQGPLQTWFWFQPFHQIASHQPLLICCCPTLFPHFPSLYSCKA